MYINQHTYKQIKDQLTNGVSNRIILRDGSVYIPFDPNNTDYQEYLKWLAEGNTPEPADQE